MSYRLRSNQAMSVVSIDGSVYTDVDQSSDGAVASPTYYLLFFPPFLLTTTLRYKTPIMFFE